MSSRTPKGPVRPTSGLSARVTSRDRGLRLVRRVTGAAAGGAVGAVVVLTGYVAHALPGHHTAPPAPASAPGTAPAGGGQGGAAAPSNGAASNGAAPSSGATAGPGQASLSPPTTSPQPTYAPPQVVSGSS